MFLLESQKWNTLDYKELRKSLAQKAFIDESDEISPLVILASSKQYGKITEVDKQRIFNLHSKISPQNRKAEIYFWSWTASAGALYFLRFLPGPAKWLKVGLPVFAFGFPKYYQEKQYLDGLEKYQGQIKDIANQYDWRNDDNAVRIVRASLGL